MPYICDENGENCQYYPDEPSGSAMFWEQDPIDLQNLPALLPQANYSNEGRNYPTPESTQGSGGSPVNASMANYTNWEKAVNALKSMGSKAGDFATSNQGIMAILAALAAAADRQKPRGGGTAQAYAGPTPVTRTMTQGKYGPIARYAANGGLMQAYAQGGKVQMEDGGFVLTKKAVDGAGGPRGLASLVPGARMIGGPPDPTGRKDLTPAVIHGPNGQTPAKVSRGEAYVPKRVVDDNGGSQEMYALMNSLQRRA
jgi:hypothetical protein